MRHVRDLNIVGSGFDRRVETKDGKDNQEVVTTYPRPANGLSTDEKARFASYAAKGLAHLGFSGASDVHAFARKLWDTAASESKAAEVTADPCAGSTVTINGKQYTLTPA